MSARATTYRPPALVQDVVLAVFVTVMQVQGVSSRVAAEAAGRPLTDAAGLGFALLVVSGLSLVVRRRWPVAVLAVTAAASVVYYALDFTDGPGWLALFVALYTVTAYGDGRRSVATVAGGIALLSVVWLVSARGIEPPEAIGWVFFRIGASVMSAALGESVRSRRVIATEALARAELAERTRDEAARARVDAERLRIAREVHDTVAHAIAIINVQAGVTAHVLDRQPGLARQALQTIEQTSARALQEMRTILGLLRDSDGDLARPSGLAQVEQLATSARDAGLDLHLTVDVSDEPLPSAVDSAAYRIVQESITNVIRHAGPTRVEVLVQHRADDLEVRITDDGALAAPSTVDAVDGAAPGRGIAGMRERCQLLGGDLTARPRPGGGFEVSARLPLALTATAR